MKKTAMLILALLLCLSLAACGNHTAATTAAQAPAETTTAAAQEAVDITGTWYWSGDKATTLTFKDGKCNDTIPYEYKEDLGVVVVYDAATRNFTVSKEDGSVKLLLNKHVYVREADFEAANALYLAEQEELMKAQLEEEKNSLFELLDGKQFELFGDAQPLEFNKEYAYSPSINITIHEILKVPCDDEYRDFYLYAKATIENTSDEQLLLCNVVGESDVFTDTPHSYNYMNRVGALNQFYPLPEPPPEGYPQFGAHFIEGNTTLEEYIAFGWGLKEEILTLEECASPILRDYYGPGEEGADSPVKQQWIVDYVTERNIPRLFMCVNFADGRYLIDLTEAFEKP